MLLNKIRDRFLYLEYGDMETGAPMDTAESAKASQRRTFETPIVKSDSDRTSKD